MSQARQLHWWSDPRQWLRALLMLDDTPHNIALGSAIGVFVAFTPTVGIQMLLVLLIAALTRPLFRFNKMAGVIAVYISNPLTMVPLYWFNYTIGRLYFPSTMSRREFAAIFQYDGFQEWWQAITKLFVDVGVPLLFGSLLVAGVCSLATYPLMLRLLRRVKSPQSLDRERAAGGTLKETVKQRPLGV
ncbi:MAG: DUF2062 domain-containing protein [Planctomycetaceae bacterium]